MGYNTNYVCAAFNKKSILQKHVLNFRLYYSLKFNLGLYIMDFFVEVCVYETSKEKFGFMSIDLPNRKDTWKFYLTK